MFLQEEQKMLRNLEEQKAREEKHRRAKETREMLDRTLRMKMEREAREEQEQLAFDLKLLEEILEASRNEAMEQAQRKVDKGCFCCFLFLLIAFCIPVKHRVYVTIIYILQRELREEDKRYRAYLEQLKLEEKERERELERLCDMEVIQIRYLITVMEYDAHLVVFNLAEAC